MSWPPCTTAAHTGLQTYISPRDGQESGPQHSRGGSVPQAVSGRCARGTPGGAGALSPAASSGPRRPASRARQGTLSEPASTRLDGQAAAGSPPWAVALEKVKLHAPAVERRVDALLSRQGLPTPAWPQRQPIQVPSNPRRAHPLSYLRLPGGPRLLMTQTLQRGSFGKFRIGRWEGVDSPLRGQAVALKELRLSHWASHVGDPWRTRSTRVTRVEDAIRELGHHLADYSPLPVYSAVEFRGKLFVCMELLGDDLLAAHDSLVAGRLADDQAFLQLSLHIAHDGAEALQRMHRAGVIHRDVKPENLMCGPDHRIRLSDLGMAAALDPASQQVKGAAGTPGYAAPEVLSRGESGPPADVWSLMVSAVNVALHASFIRLSASDPMGSASTNNYRCFHASLRRDRDGRVRLVDAIAEAHPPWSGLFARLARCDPAFAAFALDRGLNPFPAQRAVAAEVVAEARALLASRGIDPREGAQALRRLARRTEAYALPRRQLEAFAEGLALADDREGRAPGEAEDRCGVG